MSGRSSHLLVILARSPWWLVVCMAAAVYIGLRWGAPWFAGGNGVLRMIAAQCSDLAGWFAALFLLPLPFALANAYRHAQLLNGRNSLESIRDLSWQEFEHLIGEAYRRQGYTVVQRGGSEPDAGIDLELRRAGIKVVVQCKHWRARKVGVRVSRELYGAMVHSQADAAILVTSGDYTPAAVAFAEGKAVTLIDGAELAKMIATVSASANRTQTRKEPYIAGARTSPRCPRCGDYMVSRIASGGSRVGERFWGCSRFPECRGTRPFGPAETVSRAADHV